MFNQGVKSSIKDGIIKLVTSCGIDLHKNSDDRLVLKDVIFPYFVDNNSYSTVLFIGSQWYTRGYNRIFKDKNYWTLEVDPEQAKYGSTNHIIDYVENVSEHFSKSAIDLIICNGVYGYGLDDKVDFEHAIDGFNDCLREGGIFIHGWNDIPEHCPFELNDSVSLKRFSLFVFPPLSTSRYLTANPNRHTYDFYAKRDPQKSTQSLLNG